MRIATYSRVSREDQRPEIQTHALDEYAAARRLDVIERYIDHGHSGAKDRRPALDAMLAAARRRSFDAVACVRLDRLFRSVRHLTAVAAELEALGVALIVLDQGIDTSTPAGRLLFHVVGAIAEFERDLIIERTRAGLDAARRRGKRLGRPKADYGRTLVDRAKRLQASGHSIREIADVLGTSRGRAHRILRSR